MDRVCPRDFHLLTPHEWGAATYLVCPTCHGVLLERAEVEKILRSGTSPPTQEPQEEPVFEDGTALCSCEEVRMMTIAREGVAVDLCPRCKAVWFDAGELQRVVAGEDQDLPSNLSTESTGGALEVLDLVDGVSLVIRALVWFLG